MSEPISPRLVRRIERDFGARAGEVQRALQAVPDATYGQQRERLQAAVVLGAAGNRDRLASLLDLLAVDWRDLLVASGLADGTWEQRLAAELDHG